MQRCNGNKNDNDEEIDTWREREREETRARTGARDIGIPGAARVLFCSQLFDGGDSSSTNGRVYIWVDLRNG